jgi:glycosyltransferase involved in cell wall biosynthesis
MNNLLPKKRIIVVIPGIAYAYQTALALDEVSLLKQLITTIYYKRSSLFWRTLEKIPSMGTILSLAKRRSISGIDEKKIKIRGIIEDVLFIIASRFGWPRRLCRRLLLWRSRKLQKAGITAIIKNECDAVVCFESNAYHCFNAIKDRGIVRILVYGHIHEQLSEKILIEDEYINPEFKGFTASNDGIVISNERLEEPKLADHIIVGSTFSKRSLINIGISESKITVIPYGYNENRYKLPLEKKLTEKFRVLFVGGVSQRKGIKYLLEAFKNLNLKNNVELIIVGGSLIPETTLLAPYKGLYTRIPWVSDKELPSYFQKADIFVLPSIVEGFGIVLLEAMASGLPVITTHNTGGPDIIREGVDGFIVPIRDVEALQNRIYELYSNRALCRTMGINAAKQARKFTWKRHRDAIAKCVKKCLSTEP